jgi:WD40 repeat protein
MKNYWLIILIVCLCITGRSHAQDRPVITYENYEAVTALARVSLNNIDDYFRTSMSWSSDSRWLRLAEIRRFTMDAPDPITVLIDTHNFSEAMRIRGGVLAFAPNAQQIAVGDLTGQIILYDQNLRELSRWQAHQTAISALEFSADSTLLASGSEDGEIQVRDLGTEQARFTILPDALEWAITGFWFSPSQSVVAVERNGGFDLFILDAIDGSQLADQIDLLAVQGVQFAHDMLLIYGIRTVGVRNDGSVQLYRVDVGEDVLTLLAEVGSTLPVEELSGTPTGGRWASRNPHAYPVFAAAFDETGALLISASGDSVHLWDVTTAIEQRVGVPPAHPILENEQIASFRNPRSGGRGDATRRGIVAFTIQGNQAAFSDMDGLIHIWQMSGIDVSFRYRVLYSEGIYQGLNFSLDGRVLIGTNGSEIRVWSLLSGFHEQPSLSLAHDFRSDSDANIALSPNGTLIAAPIANGMIFYGIGE